MHCFANNLPEVYKPVESQQAVVAGIGGRADDVEHYSLVVGQMTSKLQIQIKLKKHAKPLLVDLAHHSPDDIRKAVAAALASL